MRSTGSLATALTISVMLLTTLSVTKVTAQSNFNESAEIILRQMEAMSAGGTTIAGPGFVQFPPNQKETIFYTYGPSEMEVCVTVVGVSTEKIGVSVGDSDDTTVNPFRATSICNTLGSASKGRSVTLKCPGNATSDCWAIWRVDKISTIQPQTGQTVMETKP